METPALAAWVADAPRHTDDRPLLELRAARSLHADTARANHRDVTAAASAAPPPAWVTELVASPRATDVAERARMLEKADSFEWALDTYREALALDPSQREASEGLVRTALAVGQAAAAEQDLQRLASQTDTVALRVGLALLYHNLGRAQEALAQLEAAARIDPRDLRVLLLGAEVQSGTGNVEAMAGLAEAALRLAPGDADVQALTAEVQLRAGQLDEAARAAEDVLRRHPAQERALEVAAIAAAGRKDRASARRHFAALVAAAPDGWSYLNNFGTFELEGGDPAAAARMFERSVDLNASNPTGYQGLLEAARALGDFPRIARAQRGLARLAAR
jgi:Tfp pilus assembly protein PilF